MIQDYLNGEAVNAPVEWMEQDVIVNFNQSNSQGSISEQTMTFINDEAAKIIQWVEDGLYGGVGITEGMPFRREVSKDGQTETVFDGFLDFMDYYRKVSPVKVEVSVSEVDSKDNVETLIDGLTLTGLQADGTLVSSDFQKIKYVVQAPFEPLKLISTIITVFILADRIYTQARQIGRDIGDIAGTTASGATGSLGAGIKKAAFLIVDIIYFALAVILLKQYMEDLLNVIYPITKKTYGIRLGTFYRKLFGSLDYTFQTNLTDLDKIVWCPSINAEDNVIFSSGDFGYGASEMVELGLRLTNSDLAVDDGTVFMYSKNDEFWEKSANFEIPDVINEEQRFNTSEIFSSNITEFLTDNSDEWTLRQGDAWVHEVRTFQKTTNNKKMVGIKGLKQRKIPVSLGERKGGQFTAVEEYILLAAKTADTLLSIFGARGKFASRIKQRAGLLKISSEFTSTPKVLWMPGDLIPSNHKDELSAEAIYNKYGVADSLVYDNNREQKLLFPTGYKIPFDFSDFQRLKRNSNVRTKDGKMAKITSLKWNIAKDEAILDGYVRVPFTNNLQEKVID